MISKDKELTTIILAAGFSSRMKEFKPLSIFEGKSFLENIIYKTLDFSKEIIIVTGYKNELIEKKLNEIQIHTKQKVRTVFNSSFQEGMFSSIKLGVLEVKTDFALLHFIDQPSLPIEFYDELINKTSSAANWIQPNYKGKNSHPVIISKNVYPLILSEPTSSNLKNVSTRIKNKLIYETNFPQVTDNFNFPLSEK